MRHQLDENLDQFKETALSSRLVYDGHLLKVREDVARLPDGGEGRREWIRHPGACAVVPLFENGDTLLLRQYRYAPARMFWEVPAGKIDAGESIDETASRELREETGLVAGRLVKVGHFYPGIGYSDEIIHVYVADGLAQTDAHADSDEFLQPVRLPAYTALAMLDSGEIEDGKTFVALQMARSHLMRTI